MATAITITILRLSGLSLAVGVTLVEGDKPVALIEVVGDIPIVGVTSVVGVLMLVGVAPIDCVDVVTVKRFQ